LRNDKNLLEEKYIKKINDLQKELHNEEIINEIVLRGNAEILSNIKLRMNCLKALIESVNTYRENEGFVLSSEAGSAINDLRELVQSILIL
jgi:hypothetical protein